MTVVFAAEEVEAGEEEQTRNGDYYSFEGYAVVHLEVEIVVGHTDCFCGQIVLVEVVKEVRYPVVMDLVW